MKANSVHEYFLSAVTANANAVAIQFEDQKISFRQLEERSNQLANFLIKNGQQNKLVGICLERSPELVISVLAILKTGGAYVPFDPEYPAERLTYMLETSGVEIILTQKKLLHIFEGKNVARILTDKNKDEIAAEATTNPQVKVNAEDPAYVLFTSGSTGMPKGVMMPHRALVNLIEWQLKDSKVGVSEKTLQFAPISFDVSFQEIFCTWCAGGTLVLIADELRLNAVKLLEFISKEKINRLYLPFIALQHLSDVALKFSGDLNSLKEIITAGEQLQITAAVSSLFHKIPHCKLFNHYGPTESHVITSYKLEADIDTWPALPSIGKAIDNCTVYLLDENLNRVKDGEEGELFLGGVCIASGYLKRPDLTSERFIKDPFADNKNALMYKTGDIGKVLPDGNIQYHGRADGQVKVRGYRIELGEIEVVLAKYPDLTQVVATVREDKPGQKRLVAYLVPMKGADIDTAAVRKYAHEKFPDYMVPASFVVIENLPKTPSGKIDRRNLPAPEHKRPTLSNLFAAPSTELEKTISIIWSDLLMIDEIGTADNFFELGGNSLLALKFIAQLQQEFNYDLPVAKMYQHPNIHAVADYLEHGSAQISIAEKALSRSEKRKHHGDENSLENSIAVVGMAFRFPGSDTIEKFWENLINEVESVTFFKDDEIDPSIDESIKNDPNYVKARGVMADADKFDAAFFGVNPRVADLMDPQQRVFLQLAWNALENAGYTPSYNGLIGVFAGSGNNTYYLENVLSRKDLVNKVGSFVTMMANEKDYIATRTAFEMNLKGPALSIHTACSTSLVAVCNAFNSLQNFECDLALAGGVAITSPINSGILYQEGAMYSPDGHCRPFDINAQGTMFSDGAGIVVLKRYNDSLRDGDTVYGLVRGVAMNNDGSDKASFTAPSVEGQAEVIAMAQANANVTAESISYIETHGTATPLGDPIEVEGLTLAFKNQTDKKQFCAIGSVKSNFGHLTAAAGVAGMIKTLLAMKHKTIPATINYTEPNPNINFADSPFYVLDKLTEWKSDGTPRRAGVSSFGVGGTNAHIILEEAPEQKASGISRPKHLIALSAKTDESLNLAVAHLKDHLASGAEINLADASYTLLTGRKFFNHRKYFVCNNIADLAKQLEHPDSKRSGSKTLSNANPELVFMFPGQGSQYVKMGLNLYNDEPVFHDAVDRCADILNKYLKQDLREILYPKSEKKEEAERLLKETYFTQPALFTLGYALAELYKSWGIIPNALIGHSIGEFVCACISGVFTLEDALFIVATRSSLMQDCEHGSMLSVRMPAGELEKRLSKELSIAAINGASLCVASGPTDLITALQVTLEQEEVVCKLLHTSHAFHSPMMDKIINPFYEKIKRIKLNPPQIPILSTVTTKWLTDKEATDPMYWAKHLRLPVRFAEGIQNLWEEKKERVLLELGPRNTAATLAKQQAKDLKNQMAISSLGDNAENNAEWDSILNALGQLWLAGVNVDWHAFYLLENRHKIPMPGYAFEPKRHWVEIALQQLVQPQQPQMNNSFGYENPMQQFTSLPQQNFIQEQNLPTQIQNIMSRKENLAVELISVLQDVSGMELNGADSNSSFIEMGFDSLFLTQIALSLSKKYKVKITFRQLNEELDNLNALSTYLDANLPAEVKANTAPVAINPVATQQANPIVAYTPAFNPTNQNVQGIMLQQMQMMMQQMQLMMQMNGAPTPQPLSPNVTPSVAPQNVFTENLNHDSTTNLKSAEISENEKAELEKPFGAIARIDKSFGDKLNEVQEKWLNDFISNYNSKYKSSKEFTQQHRKVLADPRTVTGFRPMIKEIIYQVVINKSLGSKIYDLDGNEMVDVLNGFGSNILGHNAKPIVDAVNEQMKAGYELGPMHPLAGELAELIAEFTSFDRVGFCNTGSEAVMGAMRIARTVTGRNTIVVFNGAYHGINDEVIVRVTKKLRSFPAAAGILSDAVHNVLVLDYGTEEALKIIRERADELAAVMVEPIQSRRADFHPREFLQELRKITTEHEIVYIFDEVITGFRLGKGGAQEYFGVKADLGTYGKVCGGGMPIGAIAGKAQFMDALDGGYWQYGDNSVPEIGVTYFAGTFVRHPLALAAGKATLSYIKQRGQAFYDELIGKTKNFVDELNKITKEKGAPFHVVTFGSLFKVKWDVEYVHSDLMFLLLRYKGVHIWDGFPCFLTEAHTAADVQFIIDKFRESITELQAAELMPSSVAETKELPTKPQAEQNGKPAISTTPPVPGAKLGRDPQGNPGWYIPNPEQPGKYKLVVL